jgi:hypothetical protein
VDAAPEEEGLPGNRLFVEAYTFPIKNADESIPEVVVMRQDVAPRTLASTQELASCILHKPSLPVCRGRPLDLAR